MTKIIVRKKNILATASQLIESKTPGFENLSIDDAVNKLSERIQMLVAQKLQKSNLAGEDDLFSVWKSVIGHVSHVTYVGGAIEILSEFEGCSWENAKVTLYTCLG